MLRNKNYIINKHPWEKFSLIICPTSYNTRENYMEYMISTARIFQIKYNLCLENEYKPIIYIVLWKWKVKRNDNFNLFERVAGFIV